MSPQPRASRCTITEYAGVPAVVLNLSDALVVACADILADLPDDFADEAAHARKRINHAIAEARSAT